ncbi:MAG: methylenetetrahydrofolate--tRNA-(uracil(54)-C(5))-methyltransferase (FADH(2)-oxidizing) TrmFO [Clostridia bacterium]|nr:methylenetetrahydrofolate--tRNA-(uracil(54)-C(5))-methyltransferase (FADH(2)-oxidizing) TrmFO [Clostridia bacterium]
MRVKIIGGGLAGCECAYQLLKRKVEVTLVEMKPTKFSPAHKLNTLCELVCSNSLKSNDLSTASGLLKEELRLLDSLIVDCAEQTKVPAGNALAVDREKFSLLVTERLKAFENFHLVCDVESSLDKGDFDALVVATGPLTDEALLPALKDLFGDSFLYFFDAVAPIVTADTIDQEWSFVGDRYGKGDGDYINCPMDKEQFETFWKELVTAQTAEIKDFENDDVFEGCMPIEVMAKRGQDTIRFGPLKPVGLRFHDQRPYAVVQLRKENATGTLYNLVGFQTHLKWSEQKRVFSLIPALKNAEFVRFGVMHRNTYVNSPHFLCEDFTLKSNPNVAFVGQLTGVEGYMESCLSGLVGALGIYRKLNGLQPIDFGCETITGALTKHVSTINGNFQPMNANFGILTPLPQHIRDKSEKKKALSHRSIEKMNEILTKYEV